MNAPFQFTRKSALSQPCEITFDPDSGVWLAVNGRLERLAAEYDRRGDVVLRDQARRDIDRLPVSA